MSRKFLSFFVVIATIFSSAQADDGNLSPEKQIEYSKSNASFFLKSIIEKEKEISKIEDREIAVYSAASKINSLLVDKSGKLNQQKLSFIFSIVLERLGILSQSVNLPLSVTTCHFNEAMNLKNISQGKPPVLQNCRLQAYGEDIQSRSLATISKLSWKSNDELVSKWVVDTLAYAESIGIVTSYGLTPIPKIESRKIDIKKNSVSMLELYNQASDRGKVAICASVVFKFTSLMREGMRLEVSQGRTYSEKQFEFARQVIFGNELLQSSATKNSKAELEKAWRDGGNDSSLLTRKGVEDFSKMCLEYNNSLVQKGWYLQAEKVKAEDLANNQVQKIKAAIH